MKIIGLVSATSHVITAGIYSYLFHYPLCISLAWAACDSLPSVMTQIFIPEELRSLVLLPALG
jgi:hypothetical protein